MKKIAIIYPTVKNSLINKAIEVLSKFLLDYTTEFPLCFNKYEKHNLSDYRCIYLNVENENAQTQGYKITVSDDTVYITGLDPHGLLYGCIDFYNKYILNFEFTNQENYVTNIFENTLPDFEYSSVPSVKNRGIWTWGHVIYDFKGLIDNMVLLKLNTLTIWNDYVPFNAKEIIDYAHSCGIKVIWGFPWGWDLDCNKFNFSNQKNISKQIFENFRKNYASLNPDGIYFQSFTELNQNDINGINIAKAVTDFVNTTSKLFFENYPYLEIQFGLHATSVKENLEYLKKVDKRIRIIWEDCGDFPYSYYPNDVNDFEGTANFTKEILFLRGNDDKFGAVTKGFTKLDWLSFAHPQGPQNIGVANEKFKLERETRKNKVWKYLQAYWLTNADKAQEIIKLCADAKKGNLYITPLVEDGMFEKNIIYPVALFSEILWDCHNDINDTINQVALRNYVTFA